MSFVVSQEGKGKGGGGRKEQKGKGKKGKGGRGKGRKWKRKGKERFSMVIFHFMKYAAPIHFPMAILDSV